MITTYNTEQQPTTPHAARQRGSQSIIWPIDKELKENILKKLKIEKEIEAIKSEANNIEI